MAVNNTNSAAVKSYLDSITYGLLHSKNDGAQPIIFSGTLALATADLEAGDIIGLAPVRSSDSLKSLKIFNDDLDGASGLTVHAGLYKIVNGALVVVDADCYAASDTSMRAAVTTGTELAFQTRNITAIGNEIWQDAAASADTKIDYVIALTIAVVAATPAAGDISWVVQITR